MDRHLDALCGDRPGFFLEAGGADGFRQSNTYFLERFRGWRGALIEPIPELCHRCQRNRPQATVINAALVADDSAKPTIALQFGDLMSVVADSREASREWAERGLMRRGTAYSETYVVHAPGRTLDGLLREIDAPTHPDLLSLDVEGQEEQALLGLDLDVYRFRYILVEHSAAERRERVEAILEPHYRVHREMSHHDVLYSRIGGAAQSGDHASPN